MLNLVTSQQQTWTKIDPTDMFSGVGKNPPNGLYWVDDFKMWTKPFSAQEIEANYIDGNKIYIYICER